MAIATVLAEFKAKDDASKTLKKIDAELKKTKKSTVESEKELKKYEQQAKKAGGAWQKFRGAIGGARQRIGGADRVAAGTVAGGSGGFLTGVAGVFGVGGVVAAMIGALNETAAEFASGVSVLQEMKVSAGNYNAALGQSAQTLRNAFTQNRFLRRDLEAGLSAVADLGVTGQTLRDYAREIEVFANAQGYESISEALSALTAGQVRAGRGIDAATAQLLQSYSGLLQNQFTADQGFRLIGELLRQNRNNMQQSANAFRNTALSAIQRAVRVQQQEEEFAASAVTETSAAAYEAGLSARRDVRAVRQLAAQGSSWAINQLQRVLPRRQSGGAVESSRAYVVGENGAEIFVPGTRGQVMPISRQSAALRNSEAQNVIINVTNNITLRSAQNERSENTIVRALESASRRVYRPIALAARRVRQ